MMYIPIPLASPLTFPHLRTVTQIWQRNNLHPSPSSRLPAQRSEFPSLMYISGCPITVLAAAIHNLFWLQYLGALLFQKQSPSRMIRKMKRFMPNNIRKRKAFISLKHSNYFFVCVCFKGKSTPYCLSFPSKSWTSYTSSVRICVNIS